MNFSPTLSLFCASASESAEDDWSDTMPSSDSWLDSWRRASASVRLAAATWPFLATIATGWPIWPAAAVVLEGHDTADEAEDTPEELPVGDTDPEPSMLGEAEVWPAAEGAAALGGGTFGWWVAAAAADGDTDTGCWEDIVTVVVVGDAAVEEVAVAVDLAVAIDRSVGSATKKYPC